MTHGSLSSGGGGFDLASEWMGWDNLFHCEINDFCNTILNYYWPNAKAYTDIRETDFTIWRGKIDILTGGFPCQPYSIAGKRKGKDDERHLWPEMLRAIREISPRWVVGENVRGLINWNGGLVFDEVQADLESEGYEVLPFLLPAAGVNAPHRRDRIWFVAHNKNDKRDRNNRRCGGLPFSKPMEMEESKRICCEKYQNKEWVPKPINSQSNNECSGWGGSRSYKQEQTGQQKRKSTGCQPFCKQPQQKKGKRSKKTEGSKQVGCSNICQQCTYILGELRYERRSYGCEEEGGTEFRATTHPNGNGHGRNDRPGEVGRTETKSKGEEQWQERDPSNGERDRCITGGNDAEGTTTHAESKQDIRRGSRGFQAKFAGVNAKRDVTNTEDIGLQRTGATRKWRDGFKDNCRSFASDTSRSGREELDIPKKSNQPRYGSGRDNEGPTDWTDFPTEPPVCCRNDGFSYGLVGITFPKWRNESLKLYGNAVVPEVVLQIFKAIEQYENL